MESPKRTGRMYDQRISVDFPQRLVRLKEASGLGWKAMCRRLGVDYKRVCRWRRGSEPSGGAMLTLIRLAAEVPGGLEALLPEASPGLRRAG